MSLYARSFRLAFLSILILFFASCGGGGSTPPPPPPPPTLTSIAVTPSTATVPLGRGQQFSAQGTYSDGSTKNLSSSVSWSASPTDKVTISSSGMAATNATGTVTVTASSGGVSGTATLTIGVAVIDSIAVVANSPDLQIGTAQQFAAVGTYTDGHTEDLTATATWTSTDHGIATVLTSAGRQGLVVPKGTGAAEIHAQSGAVTGILPIQVSVQYSRFGFVAEHSGIATYVVNGQTGEIRHLRKLAMSDWAYDLTLDPEGKFAYVSSDNKLVSFAVNAATGELTRKSEISADQADYNPIVHPSGKFVYQPTISHDFLYGYSVDAAGNLQLLPGYPMNGVDSLIFHPSGKFAYGLTQIPYVINAYKVDTSSGTLTYQAGYTPGSQPIAFAMDPAGQFLYVANLWSHNISAYSINPTTGKLTELPGSPFTATGDNPIDLEVDPTGSLLFVLCQASNEVRAFIIADDGTINPAANGITVSGHPYRLAVDASGKTVYVNDNDEGEILALAVDTHSGALSRINSMRTHGNPFAIALSKGAEAVQMTAKHLYAANVGDGTISAYAVDPATGRLGTPASFGSNGNSTWIVTDPSSSYLYVSNWWDNRVSGFSVNGTTGALAQLATSPYNSGQTPYGFAFDPFGDHLYTTSWVHLVTMPFDRTTGTLHDITTQVAAISVQGLATGGGGRYLYVLGAGTVAGFQLQDDGTATPIASPPIDLTLPVMGSYARGIAIDGTGKYLYVAITGYGQETTIIAAYAIDAGTGQLTEIPGAPFTTGTNPISLATDAWGRFLFVGYTGGVEAFRIDRDTGVLTSAGQHTFPGYVLSVSVDASSKYLYAAVGGAAQVRAYQIDPVLGNLTEITGSPFGGVNEPWAITSTTTVK